MNAVHSFVRIVACYVLFIAAFGRGVCAGAPLAESEREQLTFVCEVMRFDKADLSRASVESALDQLFPSGADLAQQFQVFFGRMDRTRIPSRGSVRVYAYPEFTVVSFEIEKEWGDDCVHYEIRAGEAGITRTGMTIATINRGR